MHNHVQARVGVCKHALVAQACKACTTTPGAATSSSPSQSLGAGSQAVGERHPAGAWPCRQRKARVFSGPPLPAAMDAEALDELAGQLQGEALGGRGLLQLAATTGLAAYAVWAAVLMPGFRRVPLHLQVLPKPPPVGSPLLGSPGVE